MPRRPKNIQTTIAPQADTPATPEDQYAALIAEQSAKVAAEAEAVDEPEPKTVAMPKKKRGRKPKAKASPTADAGATEPLDLCGALESAVADMKADKAEAEPAAAAEKPAWDYVGGDHVPVTAVAQDPVAKADAEPALPLQTPAEFFEMLSVMKEAHDAQAVASAEAEAEPKVAVLELSEAAKLLQRLLPPGVTVTVSPRSN